MATAATAAFPVTFVIIGIFIIGAIVDGGITYLDKEYQISNKMKVKIQEAAEAIQKSQPKDYNYYSLIAP